MGVVSNLVFSQNAVVKDDFIVGFLDMVDYAKAQELISKRMPTTNKVSNKNNRKEE